MSSRAKNRRAFLGLFFAPLMRPARAAHPEPAREAIIQGRHCLAYKALTCTVCLERCPVPEAIVLERGIPRVQADVCDGCGICREVCPAPVNAILLR